MTYDIYGIYIYIYIIDTYTNIILYYNIELV